MNVVITLNMELSQATMGLIGGRFLKTGAYSSYPYLVINSPISECHLNRITTD